MIQCNQIQQEINYLLIAFQDCNKIKNSDLRRLVWHPIPYVCPE